MVHVTTHAFVRRLASHATFGVLIALAAATLATSPAHAQNSVASRAAQGPLVGSGPKSREPTPAPASALPGENVGGDRVTPSDRSANDMSPNEALFDAVNRGDIAGARDAISRGADFNARNELGQTPLDESIDLNRNNITFMLLSLRGGPNDSSAPPPSAKLGKAAPRPIAQSVTASNAPAPKPVAKPVPTPVAAQAAPAGNDPGTPNPQRGFLGFGG